ncbi:sigma-70 family RNA polymerase sigma factor [Microbacterium sp.]|uniref:RNA polymerase sigma factor n=1 Tax=Microbacterium sp. TaxID=51671 RepID=UPI002E32FD74|nr:sigma-70 family RNA polymerase sigma factor [Microbacterium sp.]HEX5729684.1 sigma-70 family RNA polymerase sigma factor [Microbacterium sp.]
MSPDSEIIRRSIEVPSAFAELFERHARVIGAFAARRVGRDVAEDILSETFLVAFRRRRDFDPSWDSAKPWLLGIASRLIGKHRGREAAQWRAFQASASEVEPSTDGAIDVVGTRADAAADLRALAPRIAALAARDRDTLLLYAWGDLTYEQIAVAQGIPVGTVRSRLNRVRRKLAPPGSQPGAGSMRTEEEEADGRLGSRA